MCWFAEGKGRVYATKSGWLSFWTFYSCCMCRMRKRTCLSIYSYASSFWARMRASLKRCFSEEKNFLTLHPSFCFWECSEPECLLTTHQWARSGEGLLYLFIAAHFFFLINFFSTLEPNHCIFHYRKCTLKEDLFSMLMLIFLRIIFICLGRDFVAFIVILCQTQSSLNSTLSIIPTPESPQGNNVLQEQQQTLSPKYHFISMSYTQ